MNVHRRGAAALARPGAPLLRPPLGLGLRDTRRRELRREGHLVVDALDGEDGPRVRRRELAALEARLHGIRQAEQAERVGDRRTALADAGGDLLLREPVGVDQVPVRLGLLERRQVLALDVLDDRELEALFRTTTLPHDDRDALEPRLRGGPQTSLPRDQL